MREEQAVVEEGRGRNFNVEVAAKVSGSLVGQKLLEFKAGCRVVVGRETAGHP